MKYVYIIMVLVLIVLGILFFVGWSRSSRNSIPAPKKPAVVTNDQASIVNNPKPIVDNTINEDPGVVHKYQAPIPLSGTIMEEKEFTVIAKNFSFTPNVIKVKMGDKVKIIFQNAEGFHDFKIDEFKVAFKQSKSPSSQVLEFIATKTGSFEYYCSVGSHRSMGMRGTLKVE